MLNGETSSNFPQSDTPLYLKHVKFSASNCINTETSIWQYETPGQARIYPETVRNLSIWSLENTKVSIDFPIRHNISFS